MLIIDKRNIVGIADMKLARTQGELVTYALGSCIGIAFYDQAVRLGALLHIMLPSSDGAAPGNMLKYADTGIDETLRKLQVFGGLKSRLTVKMAGGAKMFDVKDGSIMGNIGQRNIKAVETILRQNGIRILAEDVGENFARTMHFDVETGRVVIRSYGRRDVIF